jgi:hypothetical protein
MPSQRSTLSRLSPLSVRLPALWVLAVSSIKMWKGSPNDIPLIVRENSPLGTDATFYATISIELAFALVALLHPRLGWLLMSALMTVFVAVLLYLISIGATSCGCFGGAISLSPAGMLAIDGSLFAFLLATRPWRSIARTRTPWPAILAAAAAGAAAPWVLVRNVTYEAPRPAPSSAAASAPGAGTPAGTPDGGLTAPPAGTGAAPETGAPPQRPNAETGVLTPQAGSAEEWKLPSPLPRWARLRPPDWVGKSIHESDLAIWMNTRLYPEDATWILYLDTCAHCRDYLRKLAAEFATDPRIYVLVKLATAEDEKAKQVDDKPPGEEAVLPVEVSWVVGPSLPPWELVLEGGIVKEAIPRGE